MDTVERDAVAVGAARLSLLVAGPPDGEPIVLLHGIPTNAALWEPVMERLAARGHRVLAADLPGYGLTRLPRGGDHSLAGAAALLARWLTESAWIVGHDAGGAVAQLMAVEHPEVVARLTLVSSIVDGSWPAPRARFATLVARAGLYRAGAALRLVPNPYVRREVRRGFADPVRGAAVDADRVFWDGKCSDRAGRRAFERHLAALTPADTARVVEGLGRLAVPVQLVWGAEDVFQPWETAGRRLERLLPAPAVVRLDGCGHFAPLDCPERLCAALLEWRAATGQER